MLKVIVGSMFAGKSTRLQDEGKKAIEEGKRVLFIKPDMDDRYATDLIVTHDGKSVKALSLSASAPSQMWPLVNDYDVFCFDEVQFFSINIVNLIKAISVLNKQAIVSGLNLTFAEKPFVTMELLLGYADEVVHLHAECAVCKEPSYISARREGFDTETEVVLGSEDMYHPLCETCYRKTPTGRANHE